jgi:FkbM family methyltransferase
VALVRRIQRLLAARGIVVHRRDNVRFGTDPLLDLGRLLPRIRTVLDVGANEGQTALPFARAFPEAQVFAFEPVPQTFSTLRARTANVDRIRCFELALGDYDGEATISLADKSGQNSLLNVAEPGPGTITVPVARGDTWASTHDVDHVDVLKIDAEGYDLEVLSGFDELLAASKVRAVLVECEFERVRPEPHTSFFALHEHLTARGLGFTTLYTDSVSANRFAWGNALFVATG